MRLSLEFPQPFKVGVEEGSVFPYGTTGTGTELVANVLRPVRTIEEITRVEIAVPQVIVNGAVQII